MIFQKNTIQILKRKNVLASRNVVKPTTNKVIVLKNEIKQYFDYNGCKASLPLLQKAKLRATKIPCNLCSWPIIIFRYSRKQKWTKQCSNMGCQSRNLKF